MEKTTKFKIWAIIVCVLFVVLWLFVAIPVMNHFLIKTHEINMIPIYVIAFQIEWIIACFFLVWLITGSLKQEKALFKSIKVWLGLVCLAILLNFFMPPNCINSDGSIFVQNTTNLLGNTVENYSCYENVETGIAWVYHFIFGWNSSWIPVFTYGVTGILLILLMILLLTPRQIKKAIINLLGGNGGNDLGGKL